MKLASKIAGNTFIQVIARIISGGIGVVIVGILTRYLGSEQFGYYTTIFAYLFFFASFADLGLYLIIVSDLNKQEKRSDFFASLFLLRILTALGILLFANFLAYLLPYNQEIKYGIKIASIATFFSLLIQVQSAYFQVNLKTKIISIAEVAGKVLLLLFTFLIVYNRLGFSYVIWSVSVALFIQFIISYLNISEIRRIGVDYIKKIWIYSLSLWRKIFDKVWPIALSQIFVLIYFKMDTIFLSLLRPQDVAQQEVGIYGAAYKVLEVLIAFVPLFMGVSIPVLSRFWKEKDMSGFQNMYQRIFDSLSFVTLPMVAGGMVLAGDIISLLAPGFTDSDKILMILMLATGVIFFTHLPTYTIIVLDRQKDMLKIYSLAAALALILYISLIPFYSYWAAAWITVLVESIVFVFTYKKVTQDIMYHLKMNIFWKALVSSMFMGISLYFLRLNVFIEIVLGSIFYFIFMYAVKGISQDMIMILFRRKL